MTLDTRQQKVSITLTAEEWDALFHRGLSAYVRYGYTSEAAEAQVAEATGQTYEERMEIARREWEAKQPVMTARTKRHLSAATRRLLTKHAAERLNVDHLGHGPDSEPQVDGFTVSLIPHTESGWPALHLAVASVDGYFAGKSWPLPEDDRKWFIRLVGRCRKVQSVWNDGPAPWVSVSFRP